MAVGHAFQAEAQNVTRVQHHNQQDFKCVTKTYPALGIKKRVKRNMNQ